MRTELRKREQHLRKPLVGDVFDTVAGVLEDNNWQKLWNKDMCQCFYEAFGVIAEGGKLLLSEQDIFRINVSLDYVLRLLRDKGLKVSYWPMVPLQSRQYLAINYNDDLFATQRQYEAMLCQLIARKPNFGMAQEELCARLMLAVIALDGVTVGNVDGRLAALHVNDVKIDESVSILRLATQQKVAQSKQYFLGRYTTLCFKILLPRSRNAKPVFPDDWQAGYKGHHKSPRRMALETLLRQLWRDAFPSEPVPEWLDVPYWIRASRTSLMLGGMPAFLLAHLGNRISGAQLPFWEDCSDEEGEPVSEEEERVELVLSKLHALLPEKTDRKRKLGGQKSLSDQLRQTRDEWSSQVLVSPNELILLDWLIWMTGDTRFKEMKLSTFQGYLTTVAHRAFPIPDEKMLDQLSVVDWEWIGKNVAENEDYAPSSRRTTITHLKRLNEYLVEQGKVSSVDFGKRCFRVNRKIAECAISFPHEVDVLLESLDNKNHWLAIACAFYLGMRCEEICHLRATDIEDAYRLAVQVSKLPGSRRTAPYARLMPEHIRTRFELLVSERQRDKSDLLIMSRCEQNAPMAPGLLSKQIGRLLRKHNFSVRKMHALRHGFASWQLVRYFMLVDRQFRVDVIAGDFHAGLDIKHEWFSDSSLADLAEVFGGIQWRERLETGGICLGNATDLVILSKLLGHANRFTTLENYTNSLGWLCRYFLRRREKIIMNSK